MKFSRVMYLLSAACVLVFSQTGLAADSGRDFNWTGPYVGLHIGYGSGNADTNLTPLPDAGQFFSLAPTRLRPDPSGVAGGIQAGYNYQIGCIVLGLEADFSGTGMDGAQTVSPVTQIDGTPAANSFMTAQENINWYGTLRPRVGYTVTPALLAYATGGLAYGNVSYSANTVYAGVPLSFPASFSSTRVGWTLGGGAEFALSKNLTIKAEYLYVDLGTESFTADGEPPVPPFQVRYDCDTTAHIVNVGVNWKF